MRGTAKKISNCRSSEAVLMIIKGCICKSQAQRHDDVHGRSRQACRACPASHTTCTTAEVPMSLAHCTQATALRRASAGPPLWARYH